MFRTIVCLVSILITLRYYVWVDARSRRLISCLWKYWHVKFHMTKYAYTRKANADKCFRNLDNISVPSVVSLLAVITYFAILLSVYDIQATYNIHNKGIQEILSIFYVSCKGGRLNTFWLTSRNARNVSLKLQNLVHFHAQIMFILPPMTGHHFWKAPVLGGHNRRVPLYS